MARLPFIGRLSWREYAALVLGFLFIALERLIRLVIFFLPRSVIDWFYDRSRNLFDVFGSVGNRQPRTEEDVTSDKILKARDFGELCALFGYAFEEHIVRTKDGYLLGMHRISSPKGEHKRWRGSSTGKPVVYLHHGLLMNSEVWVCLNSEERSLPFALASAGYDVWLGNNRGNKYSKKSIHDHPNSSRFWDFSIDDFAWYDIPDTIEYILDMTGAGSVGYVGFSQGTAQAFAALSIHPKLNEKVNVFIALAPALSPEGLAAPIVDGLMKASPFLMFLFFGRKSILSSVLTWQSILYPPIFTRIIDLSLAFLFDWSCTNISHAQKVAAYAHLYSFASVKAVVHWFQIMRNGAFVMYDDDVAFPRFFSSTTSTNPNGAGSGKSRIYGYRPARFPTRNITTPIVLLYGSRDGLVDIAAMRRELPPDTTRERRLEGYEHLDVLWGRDVHLDVIPVVKEMLDEYGREMRGGGGIEGLQGLQGLKG